MRNIFPTYYEPKDAEYNNLWENAIFVFDANVLLNLYRYTDSTRKELLQILEKLNDKLWIPHQVGLEYHSNRIAVILEQTDAFDQMINSLNKSSQSVANDLRDTFKQFKKRHPSIDLDSIIQDITNCFDSLTNKLKEEKKEHPNLLKNDNILEIITDLFTNKVGPKYSQATLDNIFKEGEERYKNKIPPGYKDRKEGSVKRYEDLVIKNEYGDLIVWKQIIDKAKKDKVPIVFVTDDVKEDWWNRIKGKTTGPRSELINEFTYETKQSLIMYTTKSFMEYASNFLQEELELNSKSLEKAIEEVKKLGEETITEESFLKVLRNFVDTEYFERFNNLELDNLKLDDLVTKTNLQEYEVLQGIQIPFELINRVYNRLLERSKNDLFSLVHLKGIIRREIWSNKDRDILGKLTFSTMEIIATKTVEEMVDRGLLYKVYADDKAFFRLIQIDN
ncbi:hypothetical protein COL23_13425 [Priestia aryabhattai]|uniref:PIN-like domain-containing protein n=1 Tax=Priestia aryabhattai TaxID=412384 RepID=UPI000BF53D8A|nr:PIN domain-containing protein [Priestia aryabhattai]PFW75833.1 hypothetical protein COL23_13425 [Priestia aryabhattai]